MEKEKQLQIRCGSLSSTNDEAKDEASPTRSTQDQFLQITLNQVAQEDESSQQKQQALQYFERQKELVIVQQKGLRNSQKEAHQEIFNEESHFRSNFHSLSEELKIEEPAFMIKNLDTDEVFDARKDDDLQKLNQDDKQLTKLKTRNKEWDQFWQNFKNDKKRLFSAAEKGNEKELEDLIKQIKIGYPLDVNALGPDNRTALHVACFEGHYKIVNLLVKNGANIEAQCTRGQRPIHLACRQHHMQIVKYLMDQGANINTQNCTLNTPLHICAEENYDDLVQLLLHKKANYTLKNSKGLLASQLCTKQSTQKIFEHKKALVQGQNIIPSTAVKQQAEVKNPQSGAMKPEQQKMNNEVFSNLIKIKTLETLGQGSFGEVYLVQKDKQQYAMKVMNKAKIQQKNLIRYATTEKDVLKVMNHPFIVKLNFAFQSKTKLFLVLQYCPGGDLGQLLNKKGKFSEQDARFYLCEILLALEELHDKDIIFRDLKPDNIVIDNEGHARLTDFGLSKTGISDNLTNSFCGSIAYLPPEILEKRGHSRMVDWYLYGVILYEFLVGLPAYYSPNRENIKNGPLKLPKSMSEEAKDLIKLLLSRDPTMRLGFKGDALEIKQHPFFNSVDWDDVYYKRIKPPPFESLKTKQQILKINFDAEYDQQQQLKKIDNWTFIEKKL